MSEKPTETRVVDLDLIAGTLRAALLAEPGLLRLEPTIRSTLTRLKVSSSKAFHQRLRPANADPTVASSDGLILTLTDGVLNMQIDIATDISHQALNVAEKLQVVAAKVTEQSGLTIGKIDLTILSIEGAAERTENPSPIP
ncbi:hypothetical protein D6T63_18370 [Arthrobacter cheniae]|uniref:Asp23/Gls24 family envelope stress response protein n=1 Tax=Arthrobacter cheniae TaxID=1258888 RepID=A0A3A5M777_9MICC|nr:hypothetical protein [Arthrobacter cheniae]RJT74884.1 hypothetical protein D6T63_18370 [Arthrobacter cheniae]